MPEEYWSIQGQFSYGQEQFEARFHSINGNKETLSTEEDVNHVLGTLSGANFRIAEVKKT